MRKETKATKIPEKVKKAVWERDGGRCIVCLRPGNPCGATSSHARRAGLESRRTL